MPIVEEAAQLPEDAVAELIERILLRCHGGLDPNLEARWKTESRLRIRQIEEGQVEGVPLDVSLARAAQSLHR